MKFSVALILCLSLPAASLPSFEAASVKPAAAGQSGMHMTGNATRVSMRNVSLKILIQDAYHLKDFQILGGPAWLNSQTWDIEATKKPDTPRAESKLMMQALLAERFHLTVRRESRQLPVYFLVRAKSGSKLKETKTPKDQWGSSGNRAEIKGTGRTTSDLASTLAGILGTTVIDKTDLNGAYAYTLSWTPDESQLLRNEKPGVGLDLQLLKETVTRTMGLSGASIYTALQETLGLKLESGKGPVDVLVIDHAEKASAN